MLNRLNPKAVARVSYHELDELKPLTKRELERVTLILQFLEIDIPNVLARLDADSKRQALREVFM